MPTPSLRAAVAVFCLASGVSCSVAAAAAAGSGLVLDKQAVLRGFDFWDNRDFDWYAARIPILETPDREIDTTWFYRWDLMTKHLVYGGPEHGYAFTEFIDRPFWSGTYGAISCPAGLQLYDLRWFRDPVYARDYARYWFAVPGAQPRRYSTWLADAVWAIHQVHPDEAFTTGLLDSLVENFEGWKRERWDDEMQAFWQIGHDDGMETNINSRQTPDWFRGAPGFRPTLNTYLWADAQAIARIADLKGDAATAARFREVADRLKARLQELLWDPEREFFFHMFRDEEEKDGVVVERRTLTHQSGPFAGCGHGRELIGYVPWQFRLPDPGFEAAWKFLMDPYYFYADFGPTTVERHDPMFMISPNCCVWSGNSWPYATSQTLKAMANVLHFYRQDAVDRHDYFKVLRNYALTHRKDGRPYLAEACHPDTGSWDGHDSPNHSEHYFHSSFIDLVVTGLVGVQPGDGGSVVVDPLAPPTWDWFALDDLPFRGRRLTVVWDRDGSRYGRGSGLQVLVDGRPAARSESLAKLEVALPAVDGGDPAPGDEPRLLNFAVNNTGGYFPRVRVSRSDPAAPAHKANDGQYWFLENPPNRWVPPTDDADAASSDWCLVDFGIVRPVRRVVLHFLDDGEGSRVRPPVAIRLEFRRGGEGEWAPLPGAEVPGRDTIEGRKATTIDCEEIECRQLRVVLEHPEGAVSGLSEFGAWGAADLPLPATEAAIDNLAFNDGTAEFPAATASFTSRFDKVAEANDGRVGFSGSSRNRWTAYESPNAEDWLAVDFGRPVRFDTVALHLYDDRGGVQAPESFRLETAGADGEWREIPDQQRTPELPLGGAVNEVRFPSVEASRLRVLFTHRGASRSGVTELEVFAFGERGDL